MLGQSWPCTKQRGMQLEIGSFTILTFQNHIKHIQIYIYNILVYQKNMFGLSIYGLVSSSLYQPLGSSMGVVFHQRLEERYRSASFIEEDPRRAISGLVPCALRWRPPLQDPLTRGGAIPRSSVVPYG